MSTERHHEQGAGGCCGGGQGTAPTLAELERQLHALWARVQEERARQERETKPAKKGCCCG
jgi:hypothetical protein